MSKRTYEDHVERTTKAIDCLKAAIAELEVLYSGEEERDHKLIIKDLKGWYRELQKEFKTIEMDPHELCAKFCTGSECCGFEGCPIYAHIK